DSEPVFMRGAADAGNVEHMAVRVARAFKIDIDLPAGFEARSPFLFRRSQRLPEILGGEAVEPAHRDIEIGAFAVPVVEELVDAAIDIPAGEDNVLIADEMR